MPVAPTNFRCWKHSLQKTGRPCVGLNGTVVSLPQAEQFVAVSTRSRMPDPAGRLARAALHALQRLGSFLKFLSAKKECFLISLMISSCWTFRLNRRRALSIDSPSCTRTSATRIHPLPRLDLACDGRYALAERARLSQAGTN